MHDSKRQTLRAVNNCRLLDQIYRRVKHLRPKKPERLQLVQLCVSVIVALSSTSSQSSLSVYVPLMYNYNNTTVINITGMCLRLLSAGELSIVTN